MIINQFPFEISALAVPLWQQAFMQQQPLVLAGHGHASADLLPGVVVALSSPVAIASAAGEGALAAILSPRLSLAEKDRLTRSNSNRLPRW